MHRRLLVVSVAIAAFAACAEPPSKEMNQAQGAIDAAKAAGAETYAPIELAAATEALRRAEDAVTQRDYRSALGYAIDSREQATAAAKTAVSGRARARGDVERQLAESSTLLAQARERLRDPEVARLPRRSVQSARTTIDGANKSVQEARTALNADDYEAAGKALLGLSERIRKAIQSLDEGVEAATTSRRRR